MYIVDLPILPADASLDDAGHAMHRSGVSAVVTERDGAWTVLTTDAMHDAVLSGRNRQPDRRLTLADVPIMPGRGPNVLPEPITTGAVDILSFSFQNTTQDLFAAHRPSQAVIVERTPRLARVVSFSAINDQLMRTPVTQGICRGPEHHKWWPYQLTVAGICELDDFIVDFT